MSCADSLPCFGRAPYVTTTPPPTTPPPPSPPPPPPTPLDLNPSPYLAIALRMKGFPDSPTSQRGNGIETGMSETAEATEASRLRAPPGWTDMMSSLVAVAQFLEYEVSHFIKVVWVEEYVSNATFLQTSRRHGPAALTTRARRRVARLLRWMLPSTPVPLLLRDAPPPLSLPLSHAYSDRAVTASRTPPTAGSEDSLANVVPAPLAGTPAPKRGSNGALDVRDLGDTVSRQARAAAELVVYIQITGLRGLWRVTCDVRRVTCDVALP